MKHAKYSPSASSRWLACPASIQMSEGTEPIVSAAAQEGTRAHECLEAFLLGGKRDLKRVETKLFKDGYPTQMIILAHDSAHEIWGIRPPKSEKLIESKSFCTHIHPELFGTVDCAFVEHFGTLHIIDFKYGRMPVEVKENTQLICYAIGIAHKFDYDFESVKLTVVQPRANHADGFVRSWGMPIEKIFDWEKIFIDGIQKTEQSDPDFNSGSHCYFCPAKKKCFAYDEEAVRKNMKKSFILPPSEFAKRQEALIDFNEEINR